MSMICAGLNPSEITVAAVCLGGDLTSRILSPIYTLESQKELRGRWSTWSREAAVSTGIRRELQAGNAKLLGWLSIEG